MLHRRVRLLLLLMTSLSLAFNLVVGWGAARRVAGKKLDGILANLNPLAARFEANPATHDFGQIPPAAPVETQFEFKNVGRSTMQVGEVKTSCGCTAAITSTSSLAPGQSGQLQVKFSPGAASGPFQKTIRVYTNAAGSPHELKIKGTIEQAYRLEPPHLNLDQVNPQAELLLTREGLKFKLTGVQTAPIGLKVDLVPDGERTRIIVSRAEGAQAPMGGAIWLGTDDPNLTRVAIPVIGPVRR